MATNDADRERLQKFFLDTSDGSVSQRWDDIWKEDFLPFDRGVANPALDEALSRYVMPSSSSSSSTKSPSSAPTVIDPSVLGPPVDPATGRRCTALVPGCGRGYDVLLLSAYGFDAVGLEISATAVAAAEEHADRVERALKEDSSSSSSSTHGVSAEHLAVYATRDPSGAGRGTARFVCGDFFGDPSTWAFPADRVRAVRETASHLKTTPPPARYDLVVDYTFLCAFPPSQRPRWARAMAGALADGGDDAAGSTGGKLLCVEFPTYKDPTVRGPPWAMPSRAYLAVLARPGHEVAYDEGMNAVIADEDVRTLEEGRPVVEGGMVRLVHYKATRTHPIGKDTDHVGIWTKSK